MIINHNVEIPALLKVADKPLLCPKGRAHIDQNPLVLLHSPKVAGHGRMRKRKYRVDMLVGS